MTKDKRIGLVADYNKLGLTGRIQKVIAPVVFTIIGFLLGLLSSEYYYNRSQRASRYLANVTMSRPVPFVRKFPVILDDGTNKQEITAPGRYDAMISRSPFSFYITPDGSINLYGEIRDVKETGTIVVEATGDSIRVVQVNEFDINSDSKAIEVVDSNQRPLFQLMVIPYEAKEKKTEEVIQLSYVTQQGETWLVSSRHGNEIVKSLEDYDWSKIPRLFCYPGYLYPGKRIDQKEDGSRGRKAFGGIMLYILSSINWAVTVTAVAAAITAVATAVIAWATILIRRSNALATRIAVGEIMPVLNFRVDRKESPVWIVENVGKGVALNVLIAHETPNGKVDEPIRDYNALLPGKFYRIMWEEKPFKFVAQYTDVYEQRYTVMCARNINSVRNSWVYEEWIEKEKKPMWRMVLDGEIEPHDNIPQQEK